MYQKILFIVKKREIKSPYSYCGFSSGLFNSASLLRELLTLNGIASKLVEVNDNNDIDREVTHFRPTHVIIEALWVVPEKFAVLTKLHPNVKWIIRNHSELPFLSSEGIAINWIHRYITYPKVIVASNSERTNEELRHLLHSAYPSFPIQRIHDSVIYLPNYYPIEKKKKPPFKDRPVVDVGCFGAIRPLKNQLIQAVAAIKFANCLGKKLRFHINTERVETYGEPVLKNIRALFDAQEKHELVEHKWLNHHQFNDLVRQMDIGTQVSFSESFNITSADFIANGIPIVTSHEVFWNDSFLQANPTDSNDIANKMKLAYHFRKYWSIWTPGLRNLLKYNRKSQKKWLKILS